MNRAASVGATDAGSPDAEKNRAVLKAKLQKLEVEDKLSSRHDFDTPDEAATEVLDLTAPLSHRYGLEIYGNIWDDSSGYHYTLPEIGTAIDASPNPDYIGYHTHPSGPLRFSNLIFHASQRGNDANWVKATGEPLYLGVQLPNSVGVAVCPPGSCSLIQYGGTQGRVIH